MTDQRTPEWYAKRVGKVTASRIADLLAKTKTGAPSATRQSYIAQLVAERLTGEPQGPDLSRNPHVQRGVELEPDCRSGFEFMEGLQVALIDWCDHPSIEMAGCSPDGLVDDNAVWEGKCPDVKTHVEYLLRETPPPDYVPQVQWQMACTGRAIAYLTSYCPKMPAHLQIKTWRIERDETKIAELESAAQAALAEVDEIVKKLEAI